jgi:hypothetical protein
MKTASTVARYLAGVNFLVFGLNGFCTSFRSHHQVASRDSSWEPCLSHITSLSFSRFR